MSCSSGWGDGSLAGQSVRFALLERFGVMGVGAGGRGVRDLWGWGLVVGGWGVGIYRARYRVGARAICAGGIRHLECWTCNSWDTLTVGPTHTGAAGTKKSWLGQKKMEDQIPNRLEQKKKSSGQSVVQKNMVAGTKKRVCQNKMLQNV